MGVVFRVLYLHLKPSRPPPNKMLNNVFWRKYIMLYKRDVEMRTSTLCRSLPYPVCIKCLGFTLFRNISDVIVSPKSAPTEPRVLEYQKSMAQYFSSSARASVLQLLSSRCQSVFAHGA